MREGATVSRSLRTHLGERTTILADAGIALTMERSFLNRRRFIASAGLTITLPLLPSLLYSKRGAADTCQPAKRFLAYMFPNGHHIPEHVPTSVGAGAAWQLPPMLTAFEDLKSDLLFVSGLENQQRRREFGDHAIGCGALLTGRKPIKDQTRTNMSVDQAIADAIQACRPGLHSLQLGTHQAGPYDEFGTHNTRSISFRGPSEQLEDGSMVYPFGDATPLGKEIDPKAAFDRLFQGTDPHATQAEIEMRRAMRKSVLDAVVPHGDSLRNRLNPADRAKVDELFTGIRSLELEIEAGARADCLPPDVPAENLMADFEKQLDTMHELMAVAFQCDITRVVTFMMGDALSNRNLSFIGDVAALGGDAGDHSVSHHSGDEILVAKFRAMVLWKMEQIAAFLRKLKGKTDTDGKTVLDNSLIWISSELADGNRHNHDDKPILVAGNLGGLVKTDRHVRYPTGTDWSKVKTYGDFFINLLALYDVRTETFGEDGKEPIAWHV